jgi:sulfur transfer complex TusBCD TusB component (DsrH family)
MEQLTEDHNKASDLVRSGEMSAEEAAQSALRSRLTRSLGNKDDVTADVVERPLQEGDIVLLCSDGVHTLLSDEEMRDAVRNTGTLKESCRAIIDLALSRGAPDNATVVVFRVGSHTASRFSVHPPGKGERLAKSLSAAGLLAILAIGLIILVHGSRVYSEFRQARAKSTLPYPAATATPTYAPLVVYTERPLKAILMKTDRGLKAVQFKAWREDRLFVQAANRVPAGEWEIIFAFEKDRIYRRLIHGYPESVVSLGDGVPTAPTASARASAAPGSSASPAPAASSAPGSSTSPALPPAASDTPAGGNP